jgi:hypothetical protein
MKRRTVGRALAALAGVTAVTLAATGTATAAPPANEPTTGQHCTLDVRTGAEQCYGTYEAAITGARQAGRRAAAGDIIQGTVYDGFDYSGDSLTIYGTELCEKDGVINFQLDLGDDWKNKISSVQPWGNCWLWLYPEPNLGGDRDGPFDENTPNIGSFMDNRTQSIGFS